CDLRGLLRSGRGPGRRRLLPRGIQLQRGAGPADPALTGSRELDDRRSRLPSPRYDVPQHGMGVWAPSLRYHAGKYWIYFGDPDLGIFMTTATNPAGPWQ